MFVNCFMNKVFVSTLEEPHEAHINEVIHVYKCDATERWNGVFHGRKVSVDLGGGHVNVETSLPGRGVNGSKPPSVQGEEAVGQAEGLPRLRPSCAPPPAP